MRGLWARVARSVPALRLVFALLALGAVTVSACGSRTGLMPGGGGAGAVQSCETAADCEMTDACVVVDCIDTFCQEVGPVECPLLDPCTAGTCDSALGECVYDPVTDDFDGDGFLGALPGTVPGEAGSCGDDCDDTRPTAFPGGTEVCDGVDNDCDGIVDNGSEYLAGTTIEQNLRIVSQGPFDDAGTNDLVFGAGTFVASYWAKSGGAQRAYIHGLGGAGADTFAERLVSNVNSQSFGADLAFSGMSFGGVLSDNRSGDYELSFVRFDPLGQKLGPDVQITYGPGFSTHERMYFDQGRFVATWDDWRDYYYGGQIGVYVQRFDVDGNLIGENQLVSDPLLRAELPILAASPVRFGLVHTVLVDGAEAGVQFLTFDKDFEDPTSERVVESGVRVPHVVALGSSFLVTWSLIDVSTNFPGPVIRGALYDERGRVLVPARDLTSGATMAYNHTVLPLGDRALLVWADNADDPNYELYAKVIGLDLDDIEPRTRLTSAPYSSINPFVAITEDGRVGVLFDDLRSGSRGVYFMTLGCQLPERCDCSRCNQGDCPSCCIVK